MNRTRLFAAIGIAMMMLVILQMGLGRQQAVAEPWNEPQKLVAPELNVIGCLNAGQFQPVLDGFNSLTGITAHYVESCDQMQIRNCSDNNSCPDVAIVAQPGLVADLGGEGTLVDLGPFINASALNANYTITWIDLGKVEGTLYGVWVNAGNKSLVWYDPTEFAAHSWATPATWAEMMVLSQQIASSTGKPPWSIGNGSGPATGWPLTDWFEDILLRSAGPDIYDDLIAHDIPWTHTEVLKAVTIFGEIFGNEGYQLGGKSGTLNTHFIDAIYPPFVDPPEAYLHRQGNFTQNFLEGEFPGQMAGSDYSIFPFPDIGTTHTNAVMGAGDIAIVFNDSSEARSLINYLITTDAAELWIQEGYISPNRNVDSNLYPDPNTRAAAEQLVSADIFRFDLSDQLPSELNVYVWSQMDDLVNAAPDQQRMKNVLSQIEWMASGTLHEVHLPLVVSSDS